MKTKLWIARDKDGSLFAYENKPLRNEKEEIFRVVYLEGEWNWVELDTLPFSEMFPEVTWDNSPQQVELKLIEENVTSTKND